MTETSPRLVILVKVSYTSARSPTFGSQVDIVARAPNARWEARGYLSKGPNTKDDPSEDDSERRHRRRRKGGGLRVPSDNVPRRASSRNDSGELVPSAPEVEDPRVAPVALTFTDERGGGRPSSGPGVHEPIAADLDSPLTEPSARRPDPDSSPADGDGPEIFEVELSESTDREAELLRDDRYEEGDDRTQVDDADDDEVARRRGRAIHSQRSERGPVAPLSGLTHDGNASLDYPLLEDDYEDQLGPGPGDEGARDPRPTPNRADSVDIPIEEVLDSGSGRFSVDGSGSFGAVGDDGTDGADAERRRATRRSGRYTAVMAGRLGAPLSDGTPHPMPRAQTMALSDADLEEYEDADEGEGDSPERGAADSGWNLPGLEWGNGDSGSDRLPRPPSDSGPIFGPSASGSSHTPTPTPAPVVEPGAYGGPHSNQHQNQGQHHGAASATSAAARGGVVRPMTNRDPGDSGEIIDEELIEEIEESQRATPLSSLADRPLLSGQAVDIDSTLDLDGDDDVEELPDDLRDSMGQGGGDGVHGGAAHAKQKPPPAPSATRAAAAAAAAAAADPTQSRPRRRRGKPWFEDIFDEDYLRTLPFLTPQATQMEAQFVMDALAISAGSQVLDVGCGYGRHAMELAARGYHVVGLDSSLPLLLRGADEAQRRGLTINFVHGDMRDMAFEAQFDGAYCLFSTFGYFDDETNKKTAQNICRALKPGARCVFEVLNRDYIIAELPLRVWWEGDGCVVLEEVDFNYFSSRLISNRSVVFDDGRQLEQEISIRSFGLHELGKLLHSAGFRVVEVSGNMITKGRFFGAQSRDIVVIAERRVEKPGSLVDSGGRIP